VNELLLSLVLALRKSEVTLLSALPFRWRPSDEPLQFLVRDSRLGRSRPALLRPDAILDVPGQRRRLFLQAETGLHGLAPASPRETHALRRVERYATFFVALADRDRRLTWYRAAFGDDFAPELVLLFQSETRRARVERVVQENIRGIEVRALTFAGAAAALAPIVAPPAATPADAGISAAPRRAETAVRMIAISADLANRLQRGLNLYVETYNSMRKLLTAHAVTCPSRFDLTPGPIAELTAFSDTIWYEILGEPREAPKGRPS
jgi:hypothetical protein